MITEYNIKNTGPDEVGGNLSGGNISARHDRQSLFTTFNMMVATNPTRGLDIPSMDFVYKKVV
jgi:simple sugar transport system ATP-binding protein